MIHITVQARVIITVGAVTAPPRMAISAVTTPGMDIATIPTIRIIISGYGGGHNSNGHQGNYHQSTHRSNQHSSRSSGHGGSGSRASHGSGGYVNHGGDGDHGESRGRRH